MQHIHAPTSTRHPPHIAAQQNKVKKIPSRRQRHQDKNKPGDSPNFHPAKVGRPKEPHPDERRGRHVVGKKGRKPETEGLRSSSAKGDRDQPNMEQQGYRDRGAAKLSGRLTPEPSHATERGCSTSKGSGIRPRMEAAACSTRRSEETRDPNASHAGRRGPRRSNDTRGPRNPRTWLFSCQGGW